MLEVQSSIKAINEARQADGEEGKVSKHDNDPQLMGEAKTAMNDVFDKNVNSGNDFTLEERVYSHADCRPEAHVCQCEESPPSPSATRNQ